jgi:VRR-NUC domain-containing protein
MATAMSEQAHTRRLPLRGRPLQKAIIELARQLGWRVAHFPPVETQRGWRVPVAADGKGFPDLILVRERIIVAEIKGDGDRLTPEQDNWLHAFRMAGISTYTWTPAEWREGIIEGMLRSRAV